MGSMQHLTLPMVYCVILYALSDTAGNPLNLVLNALHHSSTPLRFLRRPIWKGPRSHLIYYTSVLPKKHKSRFLLNSLASLFDALTYS